MGVTQEGLQLLLDGEVGGGRIYYEKHCQRPVLPDPENTVSGITIGIGYDLGQHTEDAFLADWEAFLFDKQKIKALSRVCGLKGKAAAFALPHIQKLTISWTEAFNQFRNVTVPKYEKMAMDAFPGLDAAPQPVKEALLSLVFNRGTSMSGDRRSEMREIRYMVEAGNWNGIAEQLRAMKRLWPNTRGLRNRREAEAKYIEDGLSAGDDTADSGSKA